MGNIENIENKNQANCLADEVRDFFVETGCKQNVLAKLANVHTSTISFLLSGKRKNIHGYTQDRLRLVMQQIRNLNKSTSADADASA